MNESQKLLSDIVVFNKYAKFRPDLNRRETWDEIIDRYICMMLKKYCGEDIENQFKTKKVKTDNSLAISIIENSKYLYDKKILPSMRGMQFSGLPVERNNSRLYNCCALPVDNYLAFSESMFLLLSGCGVGYSVQKRHVRDLPEINIPTKNRKFLIGDSLEGWSDAVKALMKAYFGKTKYKPVFDYSDIRAKGAELVTSGGKAPGPDPLKLCLTKVEVILSNKNNGSKLTPLECHDIMCHIADAVLSGGIRRAALISLFSFDDKEMTTCKYGNWWELNPQRGRANNSAIIVRGEVKKKDFLDFWRMIQESKSGEPGISMSNNPEYLWNPCHEISLRNNQFCNLTSVNVSEVNSQGELNVLCEIASFWGTLQAGFTDFHYLRPIWRENTERDSLIGVSMTGIGSGVMLNANLNIAEACGYAMKENEKMANLIGINPAARVTTIKPEGSGSLVCGTSSGIHPYWSKYYIRNMQCTIGDDMYNYFMENNPDLIKDMDYQPGSAVIGIPIKAPSTAILREGETSIDFLDRVKKFNIDWVHNGHRSGPNYNNVSATANIRDNEWDEVGNWMWLNRNVYSGISVLPYDGGSYADAPFQECSEYEYKKKMKYIKDNPIDLTKIKELRDNTSRKDTIACGPGGCELI